MELPPLDPALIYQAIRDGTKDAVYAALCKSYDYSSAGDRLARAVKDGANEALQKALERNTDGYRPGDLIGAAIRKGTENAMKPTPSSS